MSHGRYTHSRTAWSQSAKTLYLTGKYHKNVDAKRQLTLTSIKLNESGVLESKVNLSDHMYTHTGIWVLRNRLIVTGRKTKVSHEKGERPDVHLLFDLENLRATENIDPFFKKVFIMGQFDKDNLAVSDRTNIYATDYGIVEKKGDFLDSLGRIYGTSQNGKGCFADLYRIEEDNGYQFEKKTFAFIPWNRKDEYSLLFGGKVPCHYNSIVYTSEPVKLNFTSKLRMLEQ